MASPVPSTIPNQANFQSTQNNKIDIDKIYEDFIQAIDKVRSYSITTTISDSSVASAVGSTTSIMNASSALTQLTTLGTTPQESRCHAFYRIIGFPVSDTSKNIYNPGLDLVYDDNRSVTQTYKINIIKNPISGFRALSVARESFVSGNLNIFAGQNSIDAATTALSSGYNIRPFITPLNDVNGFNVDPTAQQYAVNYYSLVGGQPTNLNSYVDINNNTPTKLPVNRQHLIRPFLVDPIIDLTINDSTKKIGIPFVPDKSFLRAKDGGQGGFVSRPLIEQVIRDRFGTNTAATAGTSANSFFAYIQSTPTINNADVISQVDDVYNLSDQAQFNKFFNIIQAMVKKLIEARTSIEKAFDYYWVPVPSLTGPEGGCAVQGVFLSSAIPSTFVTAKDQAIIMATIQNVIGQANILTANIDATPDVGGFAFDSFKTTFSPDTSAALGDNSSQNLTSLSKTRSAVLTKANDALRTVEIIMGEFSGFGLCDIIAVLAGLYLMPQSDLLGFLDKDALARMNADPSGIQGSASDLTTATTSFIQVVQGFYTLMDKIYADMSQNNGQSQS